MIYKAIELERRITLPNIPKETEVFNNGIYEIENPRKHYIDNENNNN